MRGAVHEAVLVPKLRGVLGTTRDRLQFIALALAPGFGQTPAGGAGRVVRDVLDCTNALPGRARSAARGRDGDGRRRYTRSPGSTTANETEDGMFTNRDSGTRIDEIALGIYRISTPVDKLPGGFSFDQYLIADPAPLLFH